MLQFAVGFQLAASILQTSIILAQVEIGGWNPLKKLVDGTVDLAYKRGCMDGFIVGAILVLIVMVRRQPCRGENSV
jgi:hypothetical protein